MAVMLVAAVAVALAVGLRPPASAASSGITMSSSVQTSFPDSITFKVHAQSGSNIKQLRLHYVVVRQNLASVVSEGWAQFNPATTVDTKWFYDMRKASLPPATEIQYWWTAQDASGKTAETGKATMSFDDTRFKWQSIASAPITLYWYSGSTSFAKALLQAGQDGLKRIADDIGVVPAPGSSVKVYIYGSLADQQSAGLFLPQWEGGVTFYDFDVSTIPVPTDQLDLGETTIAHELTHWTVHTLTFNPYGAGLPTWLDEGLATYGESATVNPVYTQWLKSAIASNQLISVRSLSGPFSAVASQAYTSYGEANSIVTFLIRQYGKDRMDQLLQVFHQGSGYDEALKQVYGFDQDGLDALWRQSIGAKPETTPTTAPAGAQVTVAGLVPAGAY